MALCDVVDQFLNKNGLANAGTAEQTDLAALCIRREKVDNLNTGDENFSFGRLVGEQRRFCVDWVRLCSANRATLVDWLADHVHDAAKGHWANWNRNLRAGVTHGLTAGQTFGRVHCDGANGVLAKMLCHFKDEAVAVVVGFKCRQNGRQLAREGYVDNSADDLRNAARCTGNVNRGLASTSLWSGSLGCSSFFHRRFFSGCGRCCGLFWSGGLLRGGCHLLLPCLWMSLKRFCACDNFDKFSGNRRLTRAVILNSQLVDHVARIARCVVHCGHF